MATWTVPGWCPPADEPSPFRWEIDALIGGEWSPQSILYGGSPDGVALADTLRTWVAQRGGPAARWRLQVVDRSTATVASEHAEWFDAHQPPTKRMRNSRAL